MNINGQDVHVITLLGRFTRYLCRLTFAVTKVRQRYRIQIHIHID